MKPDENIITMYLHFNGKREFLLSHLTAQGICSEAANTKVELPNVNSSV